MFLSPEMYIGVEKGKKYGKGISNSTILEVRLTMLIVMQCSVSVGFVKMSEY